MITVEEAKSILIENTFRLEKTVIRKINNCSGYFTSEDIYSSLDLPPFDQSNVDGYAAAKAKLNSRKIIAEIKAGDNPKIKIKSGECARIFTGAVVPDGTEYIVMQEDVIRNHNNIILNYTDELKGNFVRKKGSQIRKGVLAIPKDTYISPAVAGFLAGLGISNIRVYGKPVVNMIITGNELQTPGKKLKRGKVYESNSYLIRSAIEQMNIKMGEIIFIKDDKDILKNTVCDLEKRSDVLLISGGVSVGKYDFVCEILEDLGVKKLFYKVSQRPGKPIYFGKSDSTYIFGLPGNPASVFTCFYEYVYPLLRKLMGFREHFLMVKKLRTAEEIIKSFKLSNFLKARTAGVRVEPLDGQASYILKTLTGADCFIYLPMEKNIVKKGESVEVHLFP